MGWEGRTVELPIEELRAAFPLPVFADYMLGDIERLRPPAG
jgi:hypothetical protein